VDHPVAGRDNSRDGWNLVRNGVAFLRGLSQRFADDLELPFDRRAHH